MLMSPDGKELKPDIDNCVHVFHATASSSSSAADLVVGESGERSSGAEGSGDSAGEAAATVWGAVPRRKQRPLQGVS